MFANSFNLNIQRRKLYFYRRRASTYIAATLLVLKMAAVHATTSTILSSFLPKFSTSAASFASRTTTLKMRQLALPLLLPLSLSVPAAIQLKIPTLLGDLWESVLRAVPKKKTSYMKKRSRFMAGKALKDVTALNRCSACGHVKRAHVLCPYCVQGKLDFDKQLRNLPDNDCCRDQNLVQVVNYVLVGKGETHGQFGIYVRNKQHRRGFWVKHMYWRLGWIGWSSRSVPFEKSLIIALYEPVLEYETCQSQYPILPKFKGNFCICKIIAAIFSIYNPP